MNKKIYILLFLLILCFGLIGCGKKENEKESAELSAEKKAYEAYKKKTSPKFYEVNEENYPEILKDRYGIDIKKIEETGFIFDEVSASTTRDAKDNDITEIITIKYTRKDKNTSQEVFKVLFDEAREVGNGVIYTSDINETPKELSNEDLKQYTASSNEFMYLWEGRTYTIRCSRPEPGSGNNKYYISFSLELKNTMERIKSSPKISENNYKDIIKEYYGTDVYFSDEYEFYEIGRLFSVFDGTELEFSMSSTRLTEEGSITESYDEVTEEQWLEFFKEIAKKYFDGTKELSSKGLYKAELNEEIYEWKKGEKVENFDDLELSDDGMFKYYTWYYQWNKKEIRIQISLDYANRISISFTCADY